MCTFFFLLGLVCGSLRGTMSPCDGCVFVLICFVPFVAIVIVLLLLFFNRPVSMTIFNYVNGCVFRMVNSNWGILIVPNLWIIIDENKSIANTTMGKVMELYVCLSVCVSTTSLVVGQCGPNEKCWLWWFVV